MAAKKGMTKTVGGIGPRDIQVATPLLVFRSQASVDAAEIPGVVSNELNIPVAGDIGISIAKIYGQIRYDSALVAGVSTIVQEVDMDEDNTDVEGGGVDTDIENSNTSRIFVQQSGYSSIAAAVGFLGGDTLVIDFTGVDLVSRPLTNRNLRHHVRQAQPVAADTDFSAMVLIYYHVVRLSDRALFLLASRRSF